MDRSYYMCGTPVKMEHKYSVNNEELERLKELTRTRKGTRYYGRGLRSDIMKSAITFKKKPYKVPKILRTILDAPQHQ